MNKEQHISELKGKFYADSEIEHAIRFKPSGTFSALSEAEVYLIDAEANIEMADGNLELARTDINIIRNRVGMPDVVVTSQSGLRKALRYERTVELCNEGFR